MCVCGGIGGGDWTVASELRLRIKIKNETYQDYALFPLSKPLWGSIEPGHIPRVWAPLRKEGCPVPVEGDFDSVPWFCLDDPFTTERVFVVPWPPGGQDDPVGCGQVAAARG